MLNMGIHALLLVLAALAAPAQAHWMVAQKGTLNFSGNGAYLLLSLPVSALTGVDSDGDQRLSVAELQAHTSDIERQVRAGVQLQGDGQPLRLEGLMMQLSPPDDTPDAPADQLVVMGRFAAGDSAGLAEDAAYALSLGLFGHTAAERAFDVTVTRSQQHPTPQARAPSHLAHFTPDQPAQRLFPAAGAMFLKQVRSGAIHVWAGLDHLLFLLVVLGELVAARRGWRQTVLALSSFTVGHALALLAHVYGGWTVSPALVEPAIAATVVGMAVFHLWQAHCQRWSSHGVLLWLVFGCALIHGLGLAGALDTLGLVGADLALALLGFNLGVELAQVTVAAGAVAAVAVARRLGGFNRAQWGQAMASLGGLAGAWWFIERVAG